MDGQKVLGVIGIYRKFFEWLDIPKADFPHDKTVDILEEVDGVGNVLAHCHGMLDKMEVFVAEGRMDKVFRWLGFIQGCLWATGQHNLEELKNHNRSDSA